MPGVRVHLETERLVLRRFTGDDVELLVALDGDPEVLRFITARPTTRADVERTVLPRFLAHYERHPELATWAAHERATGAFVGWFSLRPDEDGVPELGYRLRRAAWGRGYATEGAAALLHRAFAVLGVPHVVAQTMTVNHASRRVLARVGLRHVATVHLDWGETLPGGEHGDVRYAAERDEWLATRSGTKRPSGASQRKPLQELS